MANLFDLWRVRLAELGPVHGEVLSHWHLRGHVQAGPSQLVQVLANIPHHAVRLLALIFDPQRRRAQRLQHDKHVDPERHGNGGGRPEHGQTKC